MEKVSSSSSSSLLTYTVITMVIYCRYQMNNTRLYMPIGQETMSDLWAPEFLSEMMYHNRVH